MDRLAKAYLTASHYHTGQFYGAQPYINHLTRVEELVRNSGYSDTYLIVALLHDILEDTDCTPLEIEKEFGCVVRDAVIAMTHKSGFSYRDYVLEQVCKNDIAKVIKFFDATDNLCNSVLNKEKGHLTEKYIGALHMLTFGY